jgi:multiple sugar transport system ATP-binding protein
MSTIEIRKVTKQFGSFTAVKDADLKVEAGEHDVVLVEQATGARVEAKVRIDADKVVTRTVVREGPATLRLQ